MSPKYAEGMANGVDPYQTAHQAYLSEVSLRYSCIIEY